MIKKTQVVAQMATQEDIEEGIEIQTGAIVDIDWIDTQSQKIQGVIESICPTNTVGKVISVDGQVIFVATTISAAKGIDLVAIPVESIETITIIAE